MAGVKVDEDLPEDVAALLRDHGVDAVSVNAQNWSGWSDEKVWAGVNSEQRALITADKGFGQRAADTTRHFGLVLLRPAEESRSAFIALARQLLASGLLASLHDSVVVVTENKIRVRRHT